MQITKEQFDTLKQKVKDQYDSLNEVHCPYFAESISFTSEGFQHMLYKGSSKIKERDRSSQYMRLKLFNLATELLRLTKTLQEYHSEKQFIAVKHNKRKEKVLKTVQYWGFIAIIEKRKIKVIVKQVGNGKKKFWSIIPNWRTRKLGGMQKSTQHTGDLEND